MEVLKKNVKMAVIIPHGNLSAQIERERRLLKTSRFLLPFYPLICPLAFYDEFTADSVQSILTRFGDFFQSCGSISLLPLVESDGFVYRPISIAGRPVTDIQEQSPLQSRQKNIGGFQLKTGSFLYGKSLGENFLSQNTIFSSEIQQNSIRVFRLVFLSLNFSSSVSGGNCCFEWSEEGGRWFKLPQV